MGVRETGIIAASLPVVQAAHKGSLLLEVVEDTVLKDEPALSPALNFPSFLGQPALPLRVEEGLC